MNRPVAKRSSMLLAAALVVGSMAVPSSVGATGAALALIAAAPDGGSETDPTVDLLLGARRGRGAELWALAGRFGARDRGAVRGLAVARLRVPASVAGAVVRTLQTYPSVGYVELDEKVEGVIEPAIDPALQPDDPYYVHGDDWGLPLIGAPAAWETSTGVGGPIVAVVDTGVDAGHADLGGRVLPGIDLVNGDTDASDDNGHGTHVAGILAATGDNALGGAGVCWGCRILPVKVLGASGSGAYSTLASGITWAADHGAKVINMSLGGYATSTTLGAAVAYAQSHGSVVVAAAGNDGVSTRFYPAAYPGVVAVGAATSAGSMIDFSNRGTDWVDVSAGACSMSTWPGGTYRNLCGTSMATPFVSGSLGLLLAAAPSVTPADGVAALEATAGPQTRDGTAYGLIHLDEALLALLGSQPAPTPTPSSSPPASPSTGPMATPRPSQDPDASPAPTLTPLDPVVPAPTPPPTATPPPGGSPPPVGSPPPAATPTPRPSPVPVVLPAIVSRAASLAKVPVGFVVLPRAGTGHVSVSNPSRVYLVVTLKRGGAVVWRRTTRASSIRWLVNLRTAAYTLTVSRPGSRSAKGSVRIEYHRR
jgi:hypothetical protein